jgi:hypothetical protein
VRHCHQEDLLYYYQSVVIPVNEYACAAWHTSLNKEQMKLFESIQKRPLKIIFGGNRDGLSQALQMMSSFRERRHQLEQFLRIFGACQLLV